MCTYFSDPFPLQFTTRHRIQFPVLYNRFLLLIYPINCFLVTKSCLTLPSCRLQPTRLLCPWDFSGKNTEVICHFLLQWIFLTQGLNLGFLHCRQILYNLSYHLRLFYMERKTRISLNFGLTYTTYLCCQILSYKMSTLLIITMVCLFHCSYLKYYF